MSKEEVSRVIDSIETDGGKIEIKRLENQDYPGYMVSLGSEEVGKCFIIEWNPDLNKFRAISFKDWDDYEDVIEL